MIKLYSKRLEVETETSIGRRERKKMCPQQQENEGSESNKDWSELPTGILYEISEKLSSRDLVSFGKVCKSWNIYLVEALKSNPLPLRGLPWLVMSHQSTSKARTCFSLLENKPWYMEMPKAYGGCFWGSFDDWLIIVKKLPETSLEILIQISLLNPFSGVEVLLPIVTNRYHKLVFSGHPCESTSMYLLLNWSPAILLRLRSSFRLIRDSVPTKLALWIPGAQDWCICEVEEEHDAFEDEILFNEFSFEDAIFFNGFLYLLTSNFDIRVIDVKSIRRILKKGSSNITKIKAQTIKTKMSFADLSFDVPMKNRVLKNLMELSGKIILVCRFLRINDHSTATFKIYKLDIDGMAWVELDSLGDYVLCVSRNCSRSFSSKEFGDDTANCIYFFTNELPLIQNEWDRRPEKISSQVDDWGIFRLGQGDIYYHAKKQTWPLLWITAPLWWYLNRPEFASSGRCIGPTLVEEEG